MSEGILRTRRRLVFGSVVLEKIIRCLLDRLPLLLAGFLFDDLAVACLQPQALTALLPYRLVLVGRAGGPSVPAPVQVELVMIELAVLKNANAANSCLAPIRVQGRGTVKSKIGAAGQPHASVDYWALRRHRRPAAIPESS
jgi:hypothetical protein